jgi:hypothetical protein
MSCDGFEEEIIDVAGGAAPSAGLEAHLRDCLLCRRRSEEGRRLLEDVDRVLRSRLRETPSADVAARAASRLAEAEARAWRPAWTAAAAAAGLGAAILAGWMARPPAVEVRDRTQAAARSRETASPRPTPGVALPAARSARVERRATAVATPVARATFARESLPIEERPRVADAVVLVPPGQDEAIQRFASALGSRTLAARPLLESATSVETAVEIPELVEIPPLETRPLADPVDLLKRSE